MIASIFYCVVVVHVLVIILGENFSDSVSCVNRVWLIRVLEDGI